MTASAPITVVLFAALLGACSVDRSALATVRPTGFPPADAAARRDARASADAVSPAADAARMDAAPDVGTDARTDADADAGTMDAGTDAGRMDAGRMDAGRMDAGRMDAGRMDAGGMDAGTDEACIARYGDAPGFILCWSAPGECAFNAETSPDCDATCSDFSGTCVRAFDNSSGTECTSEGSDPCDMDHGTELCVCSLP